MQRALFSTPMPLINRQGSAVPAASMLLGSLVVVIIGDHPPGPV